LIPHYSFYWAAVVTLLSQIILMCICAWIVLKDVKVPRKYIKSICTTLLFAAWIFYVFHLLKNSLELSVLWNLLLLSPLLLLAYLAGEYMISRNMLKAKV
jgi:hypothetical protein